MRVHQVALLLLAVLPAFARRGAPFPSVDASSSPAATYRPFDIYGPIWGVNTMWNIECHDLSHVNEELSKVNKVQQAKLVAQQHAEKAEVVTPPVEQEYDVTSQEEAEVAVPPVHETGWFKALEGVEHEFDNTNAATPPPQRTGWFKALKGLEQEYDNFKVNHRF